MVNLHAANITVGTINGNQIADGAHCYGYIVNSIGICFDGIIGQITLNELLK